MTMVVETTLFAGATALAVGTIWSAVAPEWRRILRLAAGNLEQPFQPLHALTVAERRIAVRRWAAQPVPAAIRRLHAAA